MYSNVMYYASFVEFDVVRMVVKLLLDILLVIVAVFVLPWRQWSLDEGEAALDRH